MNKIFKYYMELIQTGSFGSPSNYWGTNDPKKNRRKGFKKTKLQKKEDKVLKLQRQIIGDVSSDTMIDKKKRRK